MLILRTLLVGVLFMPVAAAAQGASTGYWPADRWRESPPEEQGVNSEQLIAMFDYIAAQRINIHQVTLVRNGYVILNADFYPYRQSIVHDVASVTKTITSTLIGVAIQQGKITTVDTPALSWFPDLNSANLSDRTRRLTIRHLLTMTSGYCRDFSAGEEQLDRMRNADNALKFMLAHPLIDEPGTRFAYCSGGCQILSALLTRATGMNAMAFANTYLFGPLGIEAVVWPKDPQGNNNGWGDFWIRPLDLAKIGYLYLQGGVWHGRRILPASWIAQASRPQVRTPEEGYGYLWWMPGEPAGLYEARGRGGQRLAVWPEKNLVAVLIGNGFDPGALGRFFIAAVQSDERLPPNPAANRRLKQKVEAASQEPAAEPASPLPSLARAISGKRFAFEPNILGIVAFKLDFGSDTEALLTLSLAVKRSNEYGDRVSPVGLDGRYRVSPTSRFDLPLAAKGRWVSAETFELVYDDFANNHLFRIAMRFDGDTTTWDIEDQSVRVMGSLKATRHD